MSMSIFHAPLFNRPQHISPKGRAISHFELYFDLVLVGSFLHLGALMNLDFGGILKEGDVFAGASAASAEQLPGIFASVPNFTAAVIFFIALWNSWYMFTNYMVRFLSNDVATSVHFFVFSVVVLAMSTVTDSGFDEEARDRFSNLYVFTRGHLFIMNLIVAYYVPHGRRFSIASCCISVFSSVIIGVATIPNTNPTLALSLFIVAILGETVLMLCSEFLFAPPVHLHLMSERHGGLILVSVGESIIQLALRKADLEFMPIMLFMIGYAMSFNFVLLYFQCAPTHHGPHALRRGGVAATIYSLFHCILEFFLLGFGVSVKIALKVVGLQNRQIPNNVFIYFGTMVFGCLVAQDVIRLTHDAFKGNSSDKVSVKSPAAVNFKRFSWILRFSVDGLVFSVVYNSSNIGIVPFVAILFSLCLFKYGIDFLSRCIFPKVDPSSPTSSFASNCGIDGHDGNIHLMPPIESLKLTFDQSNTADNNASLPTVVLESMDRSVQMHESPVPSQPPPSSLVHDIELQLQDSQPTLHPIRSSSARGRTLPSVIRSNSSIPYPPAASSLISISPIDKPIQPLHPPLPYISAPYHYGAKSPSQSHFSVSDPSSYDLQAPPYYYMSNHFVDPVQDANRDVSPLHMHASGKSPTGLRMSSRSRGVNANGEVDPAAVMERKKKLFALIAARKNTDVGKSASQ